MHPPSASTFLGSPRASPAFISSVPLLATTARRTNLITSPRRAHRILSPSHRTCPSVSSHRCRTPTMVFPFALDPLMLAPHTMDVILTGGILIGVNAFLVVVQQLTATGILPSLVTRKLVHILCGPAFFSLWPFYSATMSGRLIAAVIPAFFSIILFASGTAAALSPRSALARSLSRRGDAREALQGPFYYTLTMLALTLGLFQSPAAGVAIAQLCIGDGVAEVFGRAFGRGTEWSRLFALASPGKSRDESKPAPGKSAVGTASFALGAFIATLGAFAWLRAQGLAAPDIHEPSVVAGAAVVSVICAGVELVPREKIGDDNVSIAIVAVVASIVVWGSMVI